jgi:hypothetical protein
VERAKIYEEKSANSQPVENLAGSIRWPGLALPSWTAAFPRLFPGQFQNWFQYLLSQLAPAVIQCQREPQLGSGWVQVLPWLIDLNETINLGEIMVKKSL